MSSASTGRYQSRLLNFLIDKSQELSDRMGQAARHVKTATVWSIQLLIYPVYAMFQTGRLAGKQLQQAANHKLRRLPGSSQTHQGKSSSVAKAPQSRQKPTAHQNHADQNNVDLPLPPIADKADDSLLVRGFHKLIHWMETGTVAVKVNLFKESKLVASVLPESSETAGKVDRNSHVVTDKESMKESAEDSSFLKAVDRTVAQIETGQIPQWQEMTNGVVAGTRSLWEPVKNWYMWQGDDLLDLNLDLDDDDLTRDLWAEPIHQSQSTAKSSLNSSVTTSQVPGKPLPELVQKSEAMMRTKITEWFGKVSALVHPPTVNRSVAEIPSYKPSKPADTPINSAVNISEISQQQAYAAMAAELSAVPQPNNNLVYQSWDLLRTNAANLKENLAISPIAKSSQSLATVATAATATIQKFGETVGATVGAIAVKNAVQSNLINQNASVSDIAQTQTIETGMGEPETGRDYIEAKVVSTGYIKHPLETVLEWIDWVMLRVEEIAIYIVEWFQGLKQRFFDEK